MCDYNSCDTILKSVKNEISKSKEIIGLKNLSMEKLASSIFRNEII